MNDFNQENLEASILSLMTKSVDNIRKVVNRGIRDNHFIYCKDNGSTRFYLGIFKLILMHHSKYMATVNDEIFKSEIAKRPYPNHILSGLNQAWMHIQSIPVDESQLDYFIDILINNAVDHQIINIPNEILKWRQENTSPIKALESLEEYIHDIRANVSSDSQQSKAIDVVSDIEYLKDFYKKGKERIGLGGGIKIGIPEIDIQTQGFQPGQLVVILGEAGGGKSITMLNMAINAHSLGKNVLFFSWEMPLWQCVARFMACKQQIPYSTLKNFALTEPEEEDFFNYVDSLSQDTNNGYFIFIDQPDNCTMDEIDYQYRQLKAAGRPPDVIFVDYLGNMGITSSDGKFRDWEIESMVVPKLRAFGRRHGIPIVTAQQVNKEGIKALKKKKEEGKFNELGISSDQMAGTRKTMDYADYVFGISQQRDREMGNCWMWFYMVKGRDMFFEPFNVLFRPEYCSLTPIDMERDLRLAIWGNSEDNEDSDALFSHLRNSANETETIIDFDDDIDTQDTSEDSFDYDG